MFRIGIDVGSTYTKYCVLDGGNHIVELSAENTPVRQKEYFEKKIREYREKYPDARICSCGYGKGNTGSVKETNELSALAKGVFFVYPDEHVVLDIGGQDTKVIRQEDGNLKQFFLNDKCAAGSGLFLANVCRMLDLSLSDVELVPEEETTIHLSSVCAVFAQSEIVELIAANVDERMIVSAVVKQIFTQAKPLLGKIQTDHILLSGGMSNIKGIERYAGNILGIECMAGEKGQFLAAVGAAGNARNGI
jgi:predicted CoA-substrate-specific enzyme activase